MPSAYQPESSYFKLMGYRVSAPLSPWYAGIYDRAIQSLADWTRIPHSSQMMQSSGQYLMASLTSSSGYASRSATSI